ncbi:hypothetical protein FRC03_008861 [Tulasnella sp. 419]|nr:hypothetical protein FRC03_008861 [Tulasnella sp. 419]
MAYNEDIGALLQQRHAFARARYPSLDETTDYDDSPSVYSYTPPVQSIRSHSPDELSYDDSESPDFTQALGTLGPNLRIMSPPPWADDAEDARSVTSFSSKKGSKGESRQKNKTFIGLGLGALPSLARSSIERQFSTSSSPSTSTSTTTITLTPTLPSSAKPKTPFISFPGGRSRSRTIGSSTMSEVSSTSSSYSAKINQALRVDTQYSAYAAPSSGVSRNNNWAEDSPIIPDPRSSCILPEEVLGNQSLSDVRIEDKPSIHPFANPDLHTPTAPVITRAYSQSPSLSPTVTPSPGGTITPYHNSGSSKVADGSKRQGKKSPPPPLVLEAPAPSPAVAQNGLSALEDAWSMNPERTSAVYQPVQTPVPKSTKASRVDDYSSTGIIRPGTASGTTGHQPGKVQEGPRKTLPHQALSPSSHATHPPLPSSSTSSHYSAVQTRRPSGPNRPPVNIHSISSPTVPDTPMSTGVPQGMLAFPGSAAFNLISLEEARANAKSRNAPNTAVADTFVVSPTSDRQRSPGASTAPGTSVEMYHGNASTASVLSSKDNATTPVSKRARSKTDHTVFGGFIGRGTDCKEGGHKDRKSIMNPTPILKHKKSAGILKFWKDSSNTPTPSNLAPHESTVPVPTSPSLQSITDSKTLQQWKDLHGQDRKGDDANSRRSRLPSNVSVFSDSNYVIVEAKKVNAKDLPEKPAATSSSPKSDFLTLRPVSMALSSIPTDFLLKDSPQLPSGAFENTSAQALQQQMSQRKDSYSYTSLMSPESVSFNSLSSFPTSSGSFSTSASSGSYSPLPTPNSVTHTSRYYQRGRESSEDQTALIASMANQIKELEDEVRRLKAESLIGVRCSHCDEGVYVAEVTDASDGTKESTVVNRPRARTGTGTRFGSSIA